MDVVAFQVVTAGEAASEYAERLRQDGQYNLELEVHGVAAQTAEAMAEYVHALVREQLRIEVPGASATLGLPRLPVAADQAKLFRLLPATEQIGVALTGRCSSSRSRARRPWWCTTPRRSTSPSSVDRRTGRSPAGPTPTSHVPRPHAPTPESLVGAGSILGVTGTEPAGDGRGLPGRGRPGRAAPGARPGSLYRGRGVRRGGAGGLRAGRGSARCA